MEAKFCLSLLLIILGTLTVHGARLENNMENPLLVAVRSGECSFVLMKTTFVVCILFNWVVAYIWSWVLELKSFSCKRLNNPFLFLFLVNCHALHGLCANKVCPTNTKFCGFDVHKTLGCGAPPKRCCCYKKKYYWSTYEFDCNPDP